MLQIDVYSSRAVIRSQEPLTVGMVGAKACFRFSDLWKGLTKTVVFRQCDVTKDMVGVTSEAVIPWEVLQVPGEPVQIGIYGSKGNGTVVIPTVWVETDLVSEGADPIADTSTTPTLPVYQQLQNQIDSKSLLLVTVTNDNGTLTMDQGLSAVDNAVSSKRPVVCRYENKYYMLSDTAIQKQVNFSAVWHRANNYVLGNLSINTTTGAISVSEQQFPPGEKLKRIVSDYDAAMTALNGRLDEHAGSIDALNTQTQALEERLSGTVRRSDVQILQFTGLEEPAVYDPVGDSAVPITVDLSKISDLIEHGQTLESHSESLEKLNTDVDDLEDVTDRNSHDITELTSRVNTQSQRVDELYGFSQTNTEDLRDLDTRLGEVEEALENVGQGGTGGGGSGVHIGTEPPVDETVSLWVNPEGDAAWSDAAYYDETVTVEEAANSHTLHFPCPIADFHELHIHMTGSNAVSQLYMEAGGESTYLIAPQHGATSGTHIHLMATHQRDTMNLDVTTAAYSEHAQPGVPLGTAGIGNEAASLRLYSKDGGNDLLPGMEIRVWGVYKTQGFGTLKVRNPETGEWENLKAIQGERGKDGEDYILTEEDKQDIAEQAAGLVDVPEYGLPVANQDTIGGVKPVAKTAEMTNPVGVDELGGLWSAGGIQRVEISDSVVTLEPNKFYVFPEMSTLSITLGGEANDAIVQEYKFRFISGNTATTLELPSDVKGDISVSANRVVEVSVLDNYAVSQSWAVD